MIKVVPLTEGQKKILSELETAQKIIADKQDMILRFAVTGAGIDPLQVDGVNFDGSSLLVTLKPQDHGKEKEAL